MSEAEHVRLMYVAATRARDHLVVSLHRSSGGRGAKAAAAAISEYLADGPELWGSVDLTCIPQPPEADSEDGGQDSAAPAEHSVEARARWEGQRENLIGKMARPSFVAATALGSQEQEDKEERETPEPWRRGRAGTSVGRAVHAVLQSIDLATGDGIADRAWAQAVAEGVPGHEDEIARLARVAVESDIVKRAVASGCLWREVPVAVSTGGGSLHGFIDLLFEEDDGLVVVDYKTDSVGASETSRGGSSLSPARGGLCPRPPASHRQAGQGSRIPVPPTTPRGKAGRLGPGNAGRERGSGGALRRGRRVGRCPGHRCGSEV